LLLSGAIVIGAEDKPERQKRRFITALWQRTRVTGSAQRVRHLSPQCATVALGGRGRVVTIGCARDSSIVGHALVRGRRNQVAVSVVALALTHACRLVPVRSALAVGNGKAAVLDARDLACRRAVALVATERLALGVAVRAVVFRAAAPAARGVCWVAAAPDGRVAVGAHGARLHEHGRRRGQQARRHVAHIVVGVVCEVCGRRSHILHINSLKRAARGAVLFGRAAAGGAGDVLECDNSVVAGGPSNRADIAVGRAQARALPLKAAGAFVGRDAKARSLWADFGTARSEVSGCD